MRLLVLRNSPQGRPTQGSEASQYLEEKKSNEMLLVKAIESSIRQTESYRKTVKRCGVAGLVFSPNYSIQSLLESSVIEGDSPVGVE
tara:strand:+ start:219 stop:479 length:261 start_codon:yes stop_codon:yes gene_type:complete